MTINHSDGSHGRPSHIVFSVSEDDQDRRHLTEIGEAVRVEGGYRLRVCEKPADWSRVAIVSRTMLERLRGGKAKLIEPKTDPKMGP